MSSTRLRNVLTAAAVAVNTASAAAGPVYFVVAEVPGRRVHGDSFVVGLEDPDHIAHARDILRLGADVAGDTILFADIARGADGINRDLLAPGAPQWPWHVTNVSGFGSFGIELIDGWPSYIAADVDGWLRNTGEPNPAAPGAVPATGKIGFWSYTVAAELPASYPDQVPPVIPLPGALPAAGVMLVILWSGKLRRRLVR